MSLAVAQVSLAGGGLGFGYGEHLLLWSWRRMVAGRGDYPVLAREFAEACGEDGPEVLVTLAVFLHALSRAGRKRLVVGPPSYLGLTGDERQVLTLLAAAQNGQTTAFEAHLDWLALPEGRPALTIAACALARAFGAHALDLPMPAPATPERCTWPGAPILATVNRSAVCETGHPFS